jgi:hypothetical protein
MTLHLVRMGGITMLLVLCMFYPFLPGAYDGFAVALSTMAQLFGTAGLLLVPIGVVWLIYEARKRARRNRHPPHTGRGYYFAMASLIAASIVAIAVSIVMFFGIGISLGVLAIGLWSYVVSRLIPKVRLLKKAEAENINPTPFYLLFIPIALLLLQVTLAAPATEFSRNRAIMKSAELINEIEKHHAVHGRYPSSLLAVWKDYYPSVVGIERFHYTPNGDAYNLFFEQPRFLFDNIGTREFVMYNKFDEHVMTSHAAWILISTPEELEARQGWYAVHDAPSPHWKYFWFD